MIKILEEIEQVINRKYDESLRDSVIIYKIQKEYYD